MFFVVKSDLSTASDRLVSFVWEKQGCVTYIFDIEKELISENLVFMSNMAHLCLLVWKNRDLYIILEMRLVFLVKTS